MPRATTRFATPTLILALAATAAFAHGPTPRKVDQTVAIKAKPEAVWKVVGDFGSIATWHPDLEKSVGDGGNKEGGSRTLTFKNGGVLKESLDEWKADGFTYSYRSGDPDLKALPVSSYSATITVTPDGDGSKVEWMGRFYRGDTGNEPPDTLSDAAGKEAMNKFFGDGLRGLKAKVEGSATQ